MSLQNYNFNPQNYKKELSAIYSELTELLEEDKLTEKRIDKVLKRYPKDGSKLFSRDELVGGLTVLESRPFGQHPPAPSSKKRGGNTLEQEQQINALRKALRMKPTRTISGVTTVTVLTKPHFCQGQCIFCPNDVRMPKSYIANEPGAQRALMNRFSPYLQTYNRLQALKNIGHPTEKIELLVLGGTWSAYPERYQRWFIYECFRAMEDFGHEARLPARQAISPVPKGDKSATKLEQNSSGFIYEKGFPPVKLKEYFESDYNDELREKVGKLPYNKLIKTPEFKKDFKRFLCEEYDVSWEEIRSLHARNAKGKVRCVGLVLETRPDAINPREVARLRKLGATKIQLGVQTLDDKISEMNKRGETKEDTARAFLLLRQAGFKIHAHMMPNLHGATLQKDREVWDQLFNDPIYKPDEVKIYPTSVIKHTELSRLFQNGDYEPYSTEELTELIADMMENTPEYCRLTRIIRDIPSTEIEGGNKTTNLRELVENKLKKEKRKNPNIRAREIKDQKVDLEDLVLEEIEYQTENGKEIFLQYIVDPKGERKIAGFLRLGLPDSKLEKIVGATPASHLQDELFNQLPELKDCAIIREVHVYGPAINISKKEKGKPQHIGLGSRLIEEAKKIARENGFEKLAVISAIGTREYYEKRGFKLKGYYQVAELDS